MDGLCFGCGKPSKSGRCRSCAATARWAQNFTPKKCETCGTEITGRGRLRKRHCSWECYEASPDAHKGRLGERGAQVVKICVGCGAEFSVYASNAHRYNYCTRECSTSHRGYDTTCKRCGQPIRSGVVRPTRHCSEACRRPPVHIDCAHCRTTFRIVPSAQGKARYCSRRCYVASDCETSIERRVREIMEGMRLRFVAQSQIGPWVVDFQCGDLVVEADGDYWHSLRPATDARKTADLEARGLVVWRISETAINADDFADALQARIANHEVTHGDLPRLNPGEAIAARDEDAVVRGSAKAHSVELDSDQLALNF